MDDDDWDFDEGSCEYNTYEGVGNDLSEEVNKGHRVRDLRLLADIDAESLASQITLSATDLMAMEAGMLKLDKATAQEIAKALDVRLSDIWIEDESP